MTRDETREALAERQIEIMRQEGQTQYLAAYGTDYGDPGYCVTIEGNALHPPVVAWFAYVQDYGDSYAEYLATLAGEEEL